MVWRVGQPAELMNMQRVTVAAGSRDLEETRLSK